MIFDNRYPTDLFLFKTQIQRNRFHENTFDISDESKRKMLDQLIFSRMALGRVGMTCRTDVSILVYGARILGSRINDDAEEVQDCIK